MAATAYLLKLPNSQSFTARTLRDSVDAVAINANSEADAKAFVKAQYGDDVNAMWDAAVASIPAAAASLADWQVRVRVASPAGAIVADVTVQANDNAAAAVAASATLTLDNSANNFADGETVVVDGKTYTLQTVLTEADGHVLIGASGANSLTNLFHAINKSGGTAGTDYANATVAHPTVTATNPSGTTVVVTAKTAGAAGNAITLAETGAHVSWGTSTTNLTGGLDATATIDSVAAGLVTALNATADIAGAEYNSSTQVLTVADADDVLGDHRLFVYFIPPNADTTELVGVPGFITAKADEGGASDPLTVTLAADNYVIPSVLALLGEVVA